MRGIGSPGQNDGGMHPPIPPAVDAPDEPKENEITRKNLLCRLQHCGQRQE